MGLQRALLVLLPGGSEGGSRARACGERCQTGCAVVSLLGGGAPPPPGAARMLPPPSTACCSGMEARDSNPTSGSRAACLLLLRECPPVGAPQEPVLPPSTPPLHTGGLCSLLLTRSHLLPFRESPCGPGHQRRHDRIIPGDTGNESRRPLFQSHPLPVIMFRPAFVPPARPR